MHIVTEGKDRGWCRCEKCGVLLLPDEKRYVAHLKKCDGLVNDLVPAPKPLTVRDPVVKPMSPNEYEEFVAKLVATLDVCRRGTVYRNKQYPGVRQPGTYEIDIAVEFMVGDCLKFLLIVECKNWTKPVDRPVIQNLIQTRDAVGANKAAIASPVGFTKEAADVAKSHGVACWVVATDKRVIIGAMHTEPPLNELFSSLRYRLFESCQGWLGLPDYRSMKWRELMARGVITMVGDRTRKWMTWTDKFRDDDGILSSEGERVFDEWYCGSLAEAYVATMSLEHVDNTAHASFREWRLEMSRLLMRNGLSATETDTVLQAVVCGKLSTWITWAKANNVSLQTVGATVHAVRLYAR